MDELGIRMLITPDVFERTCKDTIETILYCLEHATKGTIYRIGPLPRLQAVRITSGFRERETGDIRWDLPGASDYNDPGKSWEEYRDQPNRVLEAMGWCVEKQKSWTADNPFEDVRSVRKQLYGEVEDFHHMEPVLVRKRDLYGERRNYLQYPPDWQGNPIWQDTEYVVVAVIKIHFLPHTIRRGDRSTKAIKKLSRTLGTEMFSLHLRERLLRAQKDLANQRFESCNIVAHELRNGLAKLAFVFVAINAEIGFLREQWEIELRKAFPDLKDKKFILARLNQLIRLRVPRINGSEELLQLTRDLSAEGEKLSHSSLLPYQEEQWVNEKIRPKWHRLLSESHAWDADKEEIWELLKSLRKAIWIGMDEDLARKVSHLPEDLRTKWPELVYTRFSPEKVYLLDEILRLLDHPELNIPHQQHMKKILASLKVLVEIIPEIEERTNNIISCLKNGSDREEF